MADTKGRGEDARIILATAIAGSLRPLIYCACIVLVVHFGTDAIKAFAGRVSTADLSFVISIMASQKFSFTASATLAGSGWFYGFRQRNLRRNTVERLQPRIAELEKMLDSRRTSSQLTTRGATRKEDKS
jgi:hypothetical protein